MWICPNCGRNFKNPNQSHTCVVIKPEDLLQKCKVNVLQIYERVNSVVRKLGIVQVDCSSSTINYKNDLTFLVLKPKKGRMDLEFFLTEEVNEFPVSHTFRVSRNRVGHVVSLEDKNEIDSQIIRWITKAYQVVKS